MCASCASDPTAGYAFGSSHDAGVRTVRVDLFDNRSREVGIEAELAEAIVHAIQTATPWTVTTGAADTTLSGTITGVELATVSRTGGTGLPQETAVRVTVDFAWADNRITGRRETVRLARQRFSAAGTFVPDRRTGERYETGQQDAVAELARAIVAELRNDF